MKFKNHLILVCSVFLLFLVLSCPNPSVEAITKNTSADPFFVQYFQKEVFPYAAYDFSRDTYIDSSFPDSSFDGSVILNVGLTEGISRSLIHFDIHGAFPSNAVIKKAYLTLTLIGATKGAEVKTAVLLMKENWLESATWNNNGFFTWTGGNIAGLTNIGSATVNDTMDNMTVEIPVNVINSWVVNSDSNFGILIKNDNEASGTRAGFASNESINFNDRPLLSVYYTLP